MIKPFSDSELRKDLEGNSKIYIYFYSPSCGPCKITGPLVEQFGETTKDIVYAVTSKEGTDLQKQLNVSAYPSLIVIENHKVLRGAIGATEVEKIIQDGTSNK